MEFKQISIQKNAGGVADIIYIYSGIKLEGSEKLDSLTNLNAELLFNKLDEWAGVQIHSSSTFSGTTIKFDTDQPITSASKAQCLIDMKDDQIYGIELVTAIGATKSHNLISKYLGA